jgi:ribonuclease BN (tRNA processing enzyme)
LLPVADGYRAGMRFRVLGGRGAWPTKARGCSGYLLESAGFSLLIDPGYGTLLALFELIDPTRVDAVIVSHGHPDHCADLNPLLRCRALRDEPAVALSTYALPGALDAVLALDRPGMLDAAIDRRDFAAGARVSIGPYEIDTYSLPHFVPSAGMRIRAEGQVVAYTGDTGPSDALVDLARDADLFVADSSFTDAVPADSAPYLSSAALAAATAGRADAARLLLTHLMPETPNEAALESAARHYGGPINVAQPGLDVRLG